MRPDLKTPSPVYLRVLFATPLVLPLALGLANAPDLLWLAALAAFSALSLFVRLPCRYIGLFLAALVWLFLLAELVSLAGAVNLGLGFAVALLGLVLGGILVRIGAPWGWDRYRRMAERGRPMLEWEWVYTGARFAQSHPLYERLGPVLLVIGAVMAISAIRLSGFWQLWVGLMHMWGEGWPSLVLMAIFTALLILFTSLAILTVLLLFARHPLAWYFTWFPLVLGLPWSVPIIWYWAAGRRPNLVYRHRFERLVRR